jgi:hypothetical protein
MTITKPSNDAERRFIINLITDDRFCKEIIPLINKKYFSSIYAREISSWVIEYYQQFLRAPKKDIQDIYYSKKSSIEDEETVDLLKKFLSSISKEYSESNINNIDYEIKNAIKFLKLRSLELLKNSISDSIDDKEPTKGEAALANFKRVEKPLGQGVSLLHDSQKVIDAFMDEDEVMFQFPGALGQVAGKMCRGDFVSFLAPMKRGKTWYLWYVAETALYHHHKIIFFTLEMTENQIIKRSWRSLVGQPKYKSTITIPYFEKEGNKSIILSKEEEREGLDPSKIEDLQKRFRRKFRKGDVRIISLPTKSASVSDLNVHLDNMEYYENFIPDVIIIDYADILIAEKSFKGEYRHQLDNIWSSLRKMAQERNCLVVTASQTEKGTFKKDVDEASAAEDIRKIAHITSGLALNQTREEKKRGILRISQVVAREEPGAFDQAVVLQCLDIGRPCIDSRLKNDVELNKVDNDEGGDEEETKYKRK